MHAGATMEQTKDQAVKHPDLAGKTYPVTGASSGIGAATALALGRARANVVLGARRLDACEALVTQIRTHGGQALALPVDVTLEPAVREAVDAAVNRFGRLDGAFNNAGILGAAKPFHELTTGDIESVWRTNVLAVFWCMKYEIAALLTSGGAIVNNASIAALVAFSHIAPLQRQQARGAGPDPDRCTRILPARHPDQRGVSGADRNGDGRERFRGCRCPARRDGQYAAGSRGATRGSRRQRPVPALECGELYQRPGHRGGRRFHGAVSRDFHRSARARI